MLDHLVSPTVEYTPEVLDDPKQGFTPISRANSAQIVAAQEQTGDFLTSMGVVEDEEVVNQAQVAAAQAAFGAIATGNPDHKAVQDKLLRVNAPSAVRHLVGMLTAYDWEFVEQAKELRGYAVSKILEETGHPDARIRLRALELLGKVTEVGLFTDRVEVKQVEITESDLDAKLMEKLTSLRLIEDATEVPPDTEDVPFKAPAE
jgi:hypothetical protein